MKVTASKLRAAVFELIFAAVTLFNVRPVFAARHLPLQDLPQHITAISILRRYWFEPSLHTYFELALSRTQYLSVYVLGGVLSLFTQPELAAKVLVALIIVATPYALRFALRKSGGDERFAALAWPFAFNPQMMLGFLNYLFGLAIVLVTIGVFAGEDKRARLRSQLVLGCLTLVVFYSHVIAFGLLLIALTLVWAQELHAAPAAFRGWRSKAHELWFLAPSFAAAAFWMVRTPARDAGVRAGGGSRAPVLHWPERDQLLTELPANVLHLTGPTHHIALVAFALSVALVALVLVRAAGNSGLRQRWLALLPFVALGLYWVAPAAYGWIAPIHTRFAVAAVLLLPLAFPRINGIFPTVVLGVMAVVTVPMVDELSWSFGQWDRQELADLDEALAHAEPGRRLLALVPARGSRFVADNVPLLHVAAYYQARGGAVATFSFADFPQSPFRFRPGAPRPLRLAPRWEWMAALATADPQHDYYDYVLVRRGYFDEPAQAPERYLRTYDGSGWKLYQNRLAPGRDVAAR